MSEKKMPLIIYDTDMDTDCDDVGALAMILEYQKRGKAKLLGIVTDAISEYSAPMCEAFCNYYDVKVPIGSVHFSMYPRLEKGRYAEYHKTMAHFAPGPRCYTRPLAKMLGKRDVDYPAAETLYRKLLSEAEDKSVTVVVVGFMTALDRLFLTEGDEYSPLSGIELFEKKVDKVLSMGHAEQPVIPSKSFNYVMDGEGAEAAFAKCPVPIYVSGAGGSVITGACFTEKLELGHPLRFSYEKWLRAQSKGRCSWDQITTLYALDPDHPMLATEHCGTICFDAASGEVSWEREQVTREDRWVYLTVSDEEMAAEIDRLMLGEFSEDK